MQTYTTASGMIYPIADGQLATPANMSTGYEGRDTTAYPRAGLDKCARFAGTLIDPSEYEDRIREKDANQSWLADIADLKGLKYKNQSNSSYCHVHAPVKGMEYWYIMSGGPLLVLSAFYAGALIKNGRNVGGSGVQDTEWLMKNGTCLESFHPPMNFSTKNTPEAVNNAGLHLITSALDCDPGDHAIIITNALNDKPTTVGIPAWGHEVLAGVKLVYDKALYSWNNGVGYVFDNSWGPWGNNGRGILSRNYSRFDEAMVITGCSPATT